MSSPAFVPERSEVWYTDGNSGFYNVKLAGWPFAGGARTARRRATAPATPASAPCRRRRRAGACRLAFTRRRAGAVKIEVFQVSQGRRIVNERRVARFTKPATWSGNGPDGYYFARFTMAGRDVRRIVLRKRNGRFAQGRPPLPPRRLRAAALVQAPAARVRRPPAHAAAGRLPAHARRARDAHDHPRQARRRPAHDQQRRRAARTGSLSGRPPAASTGCGSRSAPSPRRSPRGASRWYYGHADQN